MRIRDAAALLVALAAPASLGCGGSRFSAGEAGQGGGAGAGSGGTGGEAGEPGTGGSSSGTGGSSSGAGGASGGSGPGGSAGAASCGCAPAQYCRAGTCRNCSDLSSIQIGTPEEVLDHPSSGLRFPRAGDSPSSLFFTLVGATRAELWYVADPEAAGSVTLGDARTPSRSGLLYVEGAGGAFNALFDESVNGARAVVSATFASGALTNVVPAGAPFGAGEFDDYSVALAARTRRVYFMTTRDGAPSLRTGLVGEEQTQPVGLAIPATGGGATCSLAGEDATPWVSEGGDLLVFRSSPMDASCQPMDGAATDLYAVALAPTTGLPLTPAVALSGANGAASDATESDPSFSPDLCTLYFASDGGSGENFDFRLFRAPRR